MRLSNKELAFCEELREIEREQKTKNKYTEASRLYEAWQWDQSGRFDRVLFESYPEPKR